MIGRERDDVRTYRLGARMHPRTRQHKCQDNTEVEMGRDIDIVTLTLRLRRKATMDATSSRM